MTKEIIISEKQEQIALVSRCQKHRGKYFIYSNENSLKIPLPTEIPLKYRQIIHQCIIKVTNDRIRAGQINGIPDLFVPSLNLYIEMKIKGGKVSLEQVECHKQLESQGKKVVVAYSALEAWEYILEREKEVKNDTV
jgi:tricorn protease-like protein